MSAAAVTLLAALLAASGEDAEGRAERPRIVVLELSHASDVDAQVAAALTDAITSEIASRGLFEVLSSREVQTLLNVERQRQLLGCSEDATSCLSELAGAMGARFVLSGTLARLGGTWQLSLQTLDSQKAQPVGRSTRLARDVEALRAQLPWTVAEATGAPLPPPPSRAIPYALMGGGAAVAVGGAILTINGFTREAALRRELEFADTGAGALRPFPQYEADQRDIRGQKVVGFSALAVGAALIGTGILLNPSEGASGGARVALVPTGSGVAVTGIFP